MTNRATDKIRFDRQPQDRENAWPYCTVHASRPRRRGDRIKRNVRFWHKADISLDEQSINVTKYKPDTDKRARVIAQSDLFDGGSVRFPRRAAWLEEFKAELLAFPGRHDDQVDALTQGLACGRERRGEVSCGHVTGFF